MHTGTSRALVAERVRGINDLCKRELAKKIIASTSPYAVTYVRLAPSLVNTPEEVDTAIRAVRDIARS